MVPITSIPIVLRLSCLDIGVYDAQKPRVSLTERNASGTELDGRSRAMDFRDVDEADDHELNEILWRAIQGTAAPPPLRSYFSGHRGTP